MLERIHILISIISALAVTIVSIIDGSSLNVMVMRLITVIIVFYIVGLIVRSYLSRKVFIEKKKDSLSESELIENAEEELQDSDIQQDVTASDVK